ncbi:STAS domain-containing protein [Nonomuraea rhizosphaerae]|uniref:STAS domain-containing protein n=1 Tax=Nonomuraea rhizosphaerae TaxID=2665663 RepID=UPI001C6049FA|nr:STAS domain-containing protein [Nonomuraea rhizosphaerae]
MADLSVEVERADGSATVRLAGDLDKLTAPHFKRVLSGLVAEGCVKIVVDTARLDFCDSSGLWVLVEHQRRAQEGGGWLRLTGVQGVLRRVLDVTGLKAAFDSVLLGQV